MLPAVRRALAALLLVAAPALTACTGDDGKPDAEPTPQVRSLEQLAGEDLHVVRAGFCPRVAPQAVEDALGAAADDRATWSNGDRLEVAPGTTDVVHEYGCSWTAADGTVARAWVFAPPVAADQARRLAEDARGVRGCAPLHDAAAFGTPTAVVTCTADGRSRTAYHGLFGDAWLSCSLEGATAPPAKRADRWCASVLQAASD